MKLRKLAALALILCCVLSFFGCEKSFDKEKVHCVLGENPEQVEFQKLEFDDENRTVTAIISDTQKIVFKCDGYGEYSALSATPDWFRVYKLEVSIKNKSGYELKNVSPYLKRQWDMLTSESFEPSVTEIEPHSKTTTTVYALTDFNISVMRSAFVDNVFQLKYTACKDGAEESSFTSDFLYK